MQANAGATGPANPDPQGSQPERGFTMNAVWHATHTVKTASAMPAATVGKTAQEICDMVWAAEIAQGPKAPEDNTRSPEFAFMGEVFGAICDPEHWKNPFLATNPQDANGASLSEWVQAAVVWFHAATPKVYQTEAGPAIISTGYAA